jgi:hypothetical protein
MESRRLPALLAVAGVVLAVALFFLLRDDTADDEDATITMPPPATSSDDQSGAGNASGGANPEKDPKPEPEVPVIETEGGQPVGGVQEIEVEKGGQIRFIVESDVDDEVHLHGYDVAKDVRAGGRVEFNVPATIDGVFEAELEHSAVPIAEISVIP